jgi:hypothetical protein
MDKVVNKEPRCKVYECGSKEWLLNGKRHRLDGPAAEWANGDKEWCLNGEWHRIDGPAVERANGTKEWRLNGKRHRTDGPAIEWSDGTKMRWAWHFNGEYLGNDDAGFWTLWEKLNDEQRSDWKLLQHAPWVQCDNVVK